VGGNNFGDNNVRAFDEKQNVVLLSNLAVDGGTIVAGTRVDSHFVTFDPATNRQVIGSVTFSRPILGVMTTTARMNASNFLGNSAVTYSLVSASGFEAGDSVTVAGNTLTYRMTASNPSDSFRVLTAVPEPTTWAMLIAGFGLVGAAARRRRSAGRAVLA
jgi:hypothetical protein